MFTQSPFDRRHDRARRSVRGRTVRRRGITSMLAMLYLVIFATMAIGFFASTTTTIQVATNDEKVIRAQLAAESGMDFMRRHLAKVRIPATVSPDEVLVKLANALETRLRTTENLGGRSVQFDGATITIPTIDLGNGSRFACTIVLADPGGPSADIAVAVNGSVNGFTTAATRTIGMDFDIRERPGTIFNYGVASRSTMSMDSNARIRGLVDPSRGSILIASLREPALNMAGSSQISGQVSLVNPENAVVKSSSSMINGEANPVAGVDEDADIRLDTEEPEFPQIDTSMFAPYAGNPAYGGIVISRPRQKLDTADVKNVLIKANTNPEFSGNIRVDGVIYIETPNKVTFSSNTKLRGVIVVENAPVGDPTSNLIEFSSNVTLQGLDTLPATPHFPQELREMAGAIILAPSFLVRVNSNFGSAGGHMVASQFEFDSNARGTINGSVINLDENPIHLDSNTDLAFGPIIPPPGPGMRFSGHFMPELNTYREGM